MPNIRLLPLTAIAAAVLTASGCSSIPQKDSSAAQDEILGKREAAVAQQEQSLKDREAALVARANAVDAANSESSTTGPTTGDLLPPDAKAGECYARLWVPATYRTVSEQKLAKEAANRIDIIPAKYGWAEETVLVKEASNKLVAVPATYATEKETIKVADAQRVWKTGLERNAAPASKDLLSTAKSHGINLAGAEVGMCFHEHYRPAKYTTEKQDVLVSQASESVSVSKATYRTVEKRILVKEASFKLIDVPATYKTVTEKVVNKPAHTIWKKGTGPIQRIDSSTGEIMCLVDIPATYKTISKRVVDTPATTKRIEIPAKYKTVKVRELVQDAQSSTAAIPEKRKTINITKKLSDNEFVWHEVHVHGEPTTTRTGLKICLTETPARYKTVTRRVVKTAATTRKMAIPAEYKTIRQRKVVTEAKEVRHAIPATYKTVTHQELVSEGHMQWRSILCKTNMTGHRVTQIQQALKTAGYNPGPIDGVIGRETMQAVNAFQKAKGLPVDNYLNIQTLKALGVSHK